MNEPKELKPGMLVKLAPKYIEDRYWVDLHDQTSGWIKTPEEAHGQPLLLVKASRSRYSDPYVEVLWGTKIYKCNPELIEEFVK